MPLENDPIEETSEFLNAMLKIQPELTEINKEMQRNGMGFGRCHSYWASKKRLLADLGVDWKSPGEMNPNVSFD